MLLSSCVDTIYYYLQTIINFIVFDNIIKFENQDWNFITFKFFRKKENKLSPFNPYIMYSNGHTYYTEIYSCKSILLVLNLVSVTI